MSAKLKAYAKPLVIFLLGAFVGEQFGAWSMIIDFVTGDAADFIRSQM